MPAWCFSCKGIYTVVKLNKCLQLLCCSQTKKWTKLTLACAKWVVWLLHYLHSLVPPCLFHQHQDIDKHLENLFLTFVNRFWIVGDKKVIMWIYFFNPPLVQTWSLLKILIKVLSHPDHGHFKCYIVGNSRYTLSKRNNGSQSWNSHSPHLVKVNFE